MYAGETDVISIQTGHVIAGAFRRAPCIWSRSGVSSIETSCDFVRVRTRRCRGELDASDGDWPGVFEPLSDPGRVPEMSPTQQF